MGTHQRDTVGPIPPSMSSCSSAHRPAGGERRRLRHPAGTRSLVSFRSRAWDHPPWLCDRCQYMRVSVFCQVRSFVGVISSISSILAPMMLISFLSIFSLLYTILTYKKKKKKKITPWMIPKNTCRDRPRANFAKIVISS